MLTTAGGLLSRATARATSWRSTRRRHAALEYPLGTVTNAPQTYMLDGKQHVLVAPAISCMRFRLIDR